MGFENITGSFFDDTLMGNGVGNVLSGLGGDDTLTGAGGDDFLFGDDGNDTLLGGAGDDELEGGLGDDSLTGGGDNDTFQFFHSGDSGDDVVTDFLAADDILELNEVFDYNGGGVTVADLDTADALSDGWSVADDGTDVTVTFGDNDGAAGNSGGLGSVVIEGIGDGTINDFAALDAAINLQVTA